MCKIVQTDKYGRDYPDEKFVNLQSLPREACTAIAEILNECLGPDATRYYKVVNDDYRLSPGFEP